MSGFTLTDVSRTFLHLVSVTPPFDVIRLIYRFVEVVAVDDQVEASFLVRNEFNLVWCVTCGIKISQLV